MWVYDDHHHNHVLLIFTPSSFNKRPLMLKEILWIRWGWGRKISLHDQRSSSPSANIILLIRNNFFFLSCVIITSCRGSKDVNPFTRVNQNLFFIRFTCTSATSAYRMFYCEKIILKSHQFWCDFQNHLNNSFWMVVFYYWIFFFFCILTVVRYAIEINLFFFFFLKECTELSG